MRIAAALLILTSGCSFMFSAPPQRYSNGRVSCSTSQLAPAVDTAYAAVMTAASLASLSDGDGSGLLGVAFGAALAASASYGFRHARECREALSEEEQQPELATSQSPTDERPPGEAPAPYVLPAVPGPPASPPADIEILFGADGRIIEQPATPAATLDVNVPAEESD